MIPETAEVARMPARVIFDPALYTDQPGITPTPQVGQIGYYTWGFGQTNVGWYVVQSVTSKTIVVQEIEDRIRETGFMCGDSWPKHPVRATGEKPQRRHWKSEDHYGWSAKMKYGCLTPWDGKKTKYSSWYN